MRPVHLMRFDELMEPAFSVPYDETGVFRAISHERHVPAVHRTGMMLRYEKKAKKRARKKVRENKRRRSDCLKTGMLSNWWR